MYNQPKRAKRLFFDVVPKMVDEYFTHLEKYADAEPKAQVDNPVWHIHGGNPPSETVPVSFSLLLNLAGVCQSSSPDVIWGYLEQYASGTSQETHPQLDRLVRYAVTYYQNVCILLKHIVRRQMMNKIISKILDARLAALLMMFWQKTFSQLSLRLVKMQAMIRFVTGLAVFTKSCWVKMKVRGWGHLLNFMVLMKPAS